MPHSPVEVLDEAVVMATDLAPDVIVSVGGGSTSVSEAITYLLNRPLKEE